MRTWFVLFSPGSSDPRIRSSTYRHSVIHVGCMNMQYGEPGLARRKSKEIQLEFFP